MRARLWVVDNINYGVLVYDNTGEWPVYRSTFPTTASADWITMGLDGQYAYLSSADIVDVKTKKIVGQLKDEYGRPMHSEKFLELAFRESPGKEYGTMGEVKLVRTVSQFGQGIPSAVQARLPDARRWRNPSDGGVFAASPVGRILRRPRGGRCLCCLGGSNGKGGGYRSGSAGGAGGLRPMPQDRAVHEPAPILGPLERCLRGHDEARRKREPTSSWRG